MQWQLFLYTYSDTNIIERATVTFTTLKFRQFTQTVRKLKLDYCCIKLDTFLYIRHQYNCDYLNITKIILRLHKVSDNNDTLSMLLSFLTIYDHSIFDVINYLPDKILCDKATVSQKSIREIQLL